MKIDKNAFNQIATVLSRHFEFLYYVDITSGEYIEFVSPILLKNQKISKTGSNFFEISKKNAPKMVHPDDLEFVQRIYTKEVILEKLSDANSFSTMYRLILDGKIVHVRHIIIMCQDKKHLLFCMENIEKEFLEKEIQTKNLRNAERMARRDEMTGIKNKNAFTEYIGSIDAAIASGNTDFSFGVVIFDVNDLKIINDTRGHSFGDEAILKTCRMICNVFKHSPVFRIGGDEFAVVITGDDYEQREQLLTIIRKESNSNLHYRTGPVVASGMAVFDPNLDKDFNSVFCRADKEMYENKKAIKNSSFFIGPVSVQKRNISITDERVRKLDKLFGALYTVSGGGYVFLNDMKHDYSRWSLPLIEDFGLSSEYMYHADKVWQNYIHPDDMKTYRDAVDGIFLKNGTLKSIAYRARKTDGSYVLLTSRVFVLSDSSGELDYFGGIIISE